MKNLGKLLIVLMFSLSLGLISCQEREDLVIIDYSGEYVGFSADTDNSYRNTVAARICKTTILNIKINNEVWTDVEIINGEFQLVSIGPRILIYRGVITFPECKIRGDWLGYNSEIEGNFVARRALTCKKGEYAPLK